MKNHAFHDVNKRTAVLSLFYHLVKIKKYPNKQHKTYAQLAINVAANTLESYTAFSDYKDKRDAEVLFIADFLRRNTRSMEKTEFKITYRELDNILRRRGFGLSNPDRNQIDLIKFYKETTGILNRKTVTKEKRITSIGFPGWTRQVNVNAVKQVRQHTKLTSENGCDSETFYHGADSLPYLIDEFQELLKQLADK